MLVIQSNSKENQSLDIGPSDLLLYPDSSMLLKNFKHRSLLSNLWPTRISVSSNLWQNGHNHGISWTEIHYCRSARSFAKAVYYFCNIPCTCSQKYLYNILPMLLMGKSFHQSFFKKKRLIYFLFFSFLFCDGEGEGEGEGLWGFEKLTGQQIQGSLDTCNIY